MDKRKFIVQVLWSILFLSTTSLYAQKREAVNDEKSFYQANLFILYHQYEKAVPIYLDLLKKYPDNSNLQYLAGTCYLHIPGLRTRAIPFLEKASENYTKNYKKELYSETKAPLEAILFLGHAYQINNQLDKALEEYNRYKKLLRKKRSTDIVDRWIKSCELAKKMMGHPGDVEVIFPERLKTGPVVYHPAISGDGKKMAFMSDTKYYHAIYFTEFKDGGWSAPYNITMDIESDGSYLVSSLNHNGTLLYLIVPRKDNTDIFVSQYKNNKWEKAIPVKGKINSLHNEVFAFLSSDNHTLYFVSDRPGGPGGLDIFKASLSPEGKWDAIKPLPGPVNTPYDEQSPVLSANGKKLFFSSNGHSTMGGLDIFVSKRENGSWQNPANLGYPPNTTDNELCFAPFDNDFKGYITRYIKDTVKRSYIASVEFFSPEHPRPLILTGKLLLPTGKELPPNLKIEITSDQGMEKIIAGKTISREGLFDIRLPAGTYDLTVSGNGISPYSLKVRLQKGTTRTLVEVPLSFISGPQKEGKIQKYFIYPVYFDFNKFTLTSAGRVKLDKLATILKGFPGVKITIEGYTDAIGSRVYNLKLSIKRAKSVKNYLIAKGIPTSSLFVKGYGKDHPAAINRNPDGTDSPRGRQFNRRVTFSFTGNQAGQIILKQNIPPDLAIHK